MHEVEIKQMENPIVGRVFGRILATRIRVWAE